MDSKVEGYLQAPQAHFLPGYGSQSLYPSAKGKCPALGNLALKYRQERTVRRLHGDQAQNLPKTCRLCSALTD